MQFSTGSLKESVVKALTASIVSIPLTGFAMDNYAALTVSVNPNNIVGTMTQGAMINTAFLIAVSVFLSTYVRLDLEGFQQP